MTSKSYAIVPARGGSKSIPKKNIALLGGKPLINWTLEVALPFFDHVYVSTEDSEIADVSRKAGAGILTRPETLADDFTTATDVVRFSIEQMGLTDDSRVFLLQPTSPFRTNHSISSAIELLYQFPAVISVTKTPPKNTFRSLYPYNDRVNKILPTSSLEKDLQRQTVPDHYRVNGAIFGTTAERLRFFGTFNQPDTAAVIMPLIASLEIDDWDDWLLATYVAEAVSNVHEAP